MPELDLSAPVFPGHAEKRERQAARMETIITRMFRRVDADAFAAGNLLLERDELDHAENQPDKYDGGEPVDTNWR